MSTITTMYNLSSFALQSGSCCKNLPTCQHVLKQVFHSKPTHFKKGTCMLSGANIINLPLGVCSIPSGSAFKCNNVIDLWAC